MRTYIHQNSAIYATNPDRDSDSRSAFVYNKKYKFPDIHKRDEYIHTMYIFTKKHYTQGPAKKASYVCKRAQHIHKRALYISGNCSSFTLTIYTKEPYTSIKEPYISVQRIDRILMSNESHIHIHKNAMRICQRAL